MNRDYSSLAYMPISIVQMDTERIIENVVKPLPFIKRMGHWLVSEVRWLFRVSLSSADRFYRDNGFSRAASLAYTSLLSLFPVTALIFGLLAAFAVSPEHITKVREFVFHQFVPSSQAVEAILEQLNRFGQVISDPSVSAVMFGFLVFTSILLINAVEYALNEVWQVYEPRSITDRIAIFCAILVIAPVLLVSAYSFTKFRIETWLPQFANGGLALQLYTVLLPFLIDIAAFFSLYYLVPKAPVRVSSAIFGAFVAALFFAFAKQGFAVYIERFASYDKLYGAVAAVPIFLIWLYLAWSILLFGAESSYQAQHMPRNGKVWKRSILSVGDARMVLAIQAMMMAARAFIKGDRLPNELEIAEHLGCSSVILKPAVSALEKAGIISRGAGRDMPLVLLRDPRRISLDELREALFGGRPVFHFSSELSRMYQVIASGKELRKTNLADLLIDSEWAEAFDPIRSKE